MDAGMAQSTSGLEATQKALEVWADNLANANTTAFAPADPLQVDLPLIPAQAGTWPGLARPTPGALSVGPGAALAAAPRSFASGPLVDTGIPTDVALEGPGFFVVKTPAGLAYTRAGDFTVDSSGTLVTPGGDQVLSTTLQPITVGSGSISIAQDGTVSAGGKAAGRLAVAQFPNPDGLIATRDNLFVPGPQAASNAGTPVTGPAAQGTTILSGVLEGSGTNVAEGLVAVVDLSRNFALDARALSTTDQMLSWAAQMS